MNRRTDAKRSISTRSQRGSFLLPLSLLRDHFQISDILLALADISTWFASGRFCGCVLRFEIVGMDNQLLIVVINGTIFKKN